MNIFDELEIQYSEIDKQYWNIEFESGQRGWIRKKQKYIRKRKFNDQAYFVFLFSRLENRIREESAKLIRKKKNSLSSWKQKAVWDVLPDQANARLQFKKRLALLTEKGCRDFNLISEYYKERNSIAHGGGFISSVSMPRVIIELKRLYKTLKI